MNINFTKQLQKNPNFFSLDTKDLKLRLYEKKDVEMRFNILKNNSEMTDKMSFFAPKEIKETMDHFLLYKESFKKSKNISWSIFYKKELIGTVSLEGIVYQKSAWKLNKGGIGYWLSPKFHNKGFMTQVVKSVLEFAFTSLFLNKVEISCVSTNIASSKVIEKSGFRFLGEKKRHFKRDGKWQNHKIYELLASEWKKKQKPKKNKYIHEKEIWLIDLEPTKGIEVQKIRPCLILRRFSKTHIIILPITSKEKSLLFTFLLSDVPFLKFSKNWILLSQIRTIDIIRCKIKLGELSESKFEKIQNKTAEVLKLPLLRA